MIIKQRRAGKQMGFLKQIGLTGIMFIFMIPFTLGNGPKGGQKPMPKGMVKIPGGTYTSFFKDKSDVKVNIKPFYLDQRAVTNAEYLEFVKRNPKWSRSRVSKLFADAGYLKHWKSDLSFGNPQIANSPVTNVSWFAANAYSKWKGKRLPTLSEWEYAGNAALHNKKPVEKVILEWYSKPTPSVLPAAGSTFKNKFNLYDMHGLIWEWVYDFNSVIMTGDSRSNSAIQRDLFCASGSTGAINKEDYAAFMRFAFRGSLKAKYTVNNLGFRCALDIQ